MSRRSLPRLVVALASAAALACGGKDSATPTDPVDDTPKLTVVLSAGVIGTPSSGGPYPKNYILAYAYNAQPGYQDLKATLDGAPVATSGTIKMDKPHTIAVSATRPGTAAAATP